MQDLQWKWARRTFYLVVCMVAAIPSLLTASEQVNDKTTLVAAPEIAAPKTPTTTAPEAATTTVVPTTEAAKPVLCPGAPRPDLACRKTQESKMAAKPVQRPVQPSIQAPSTGSCEAWLDAAGVADKASARALISRESGCNPRARNRSSGACGVAQELPCNKSGCNGDGACQVRWMHQYVHARYGSWAAANAFQLRNGWY